MASHDDKNNRPPIGVRVRQVLLATIAVVSASLALAQTPAMQTRTIAPGVVEQTDGLSVRTIYDRSFFAGYGGISAKDMIEHVPGVASLASAQFGPRAEKQARRGLRSATDQVLINGRRVSGKEGSSTDFLEKISSKRVLRIEVITGQVKEIDSEVGARVINLVIDESASFSGSYTAGWINISDGDTIPVYLVNAGGSAGAFTFNISLEKRPQASPAIVRDRFFTPTGVLTGGIDETRKRVGRLYTTRLLMGYDFAGGSSIQFNGVADWVPTDFRDLARAFIVTGPGATAPTTAILDRTRGDDIKFEASLDSTIPFGAGHKFLGFAVYNNRMIDENSEISDVASTPPVSFAGDTRDENSYEAILRGTMQFAVFDTDTLEFGVEGARNKLDKDLDFFSIAGGARTLTPVFNSDQVITEDRVEPFMSYSWQLTDSLQIEPGVAAEFSWLDQFGPDVNEDRSFKFAKPSLNIYWTISPREQIYLNIVRDVSQLAFGDFAATVDRDGDEVLGGNPLLRPERSWDFALGTSVKFPGDKGNFGLRGFYRMIDDALDRVPLPGGASGPGNIGSGDHYGGKVDGSLKLAKFGLIDATISSSYTWQDSKVTDPFTGRSRRIAKQPRYIWSTQARHDVSAWGFSYGFEYNKNGGTIESDFDKFDRRTVYGDVRVFYEQQLGWGVSARFFLSNAAKGKSTRDRIRFVTTQRDGAVLRTEDRVERPRQFYGVRLRGTF